MMANPMINNKLRKVEISIMSARNLKLPTFSLGIRPRTYAVAWVQPGTKKQTRIDCTHGPNPKWQERFIFYDVNSSTDVINVEIYSVGRVFKDRLIGAVRVPVSEVVCAGGEPSFAIRRSSGKAYGVVTIGGKVSYDFPAKSYSSVLPSLGLGTRFSSLPMSSAK